MSSFSSFSVIPPPPPPPPPEAKAPVPPQSEPEPEPAQSEPGSVAMSSVVEQKIQERPVAAAVPKALPAPSGWQEPTPAPAARAWSWRWPIVLLAIAAGVGAGYYYHTQQPIAQQATAELSTSRPAALDEITSSAVLQRAAASINPADYQEPPPASLTERVEFLQQRLTATRESSGRLSLKFEAPSPSDAPKYLTVIIAAYQAEAAPEPTPTDTSPDADRLAALRQLETQRHALAARISAPVAAEDIAALHDRIVVLTATRDELTQSLRSIDLTISQIDAVAGKPRGERESVRIALGLPALPVPDHEQTLMVLAQRRNELRDKRGLGPDHPDMREITTRIEKIQRELQNSRAQDALDLHRAELDKQRKAIRTVLDKLVPALTAAEEQHQAWTTQNEKHAAGQADLATLDRQIAAEKNQLEAGDPQPTRTNATVEVVSAPRPASRATTGLAQSLAAGGGFGLLAGSVLVLGAGLLRRGASVVRSGSGRRLGVNLLGRLPKIKTDAAAERPTNAGLDRLLATFYRPSSSDAEAFRQVRAKVYAAIEGQLHQVIQVTSPTPGDGKSVLAANLAITIAQTGRRVLLIDANLRNPRAHQLLNRRNVDIGLSSVLNGEVELNKAIVACDVPNLELLPCGPVPNDPTEILGSAKFVELIAEMRPVYDFVIVDCSAVLGSPDAMTIAKLANGTVLVVRATTEAAADVEHAREQLAAAKMRVLGLVENTCPRRTVLFAVEQPERIAPPEVEAETAVKG